MIVTGAGETELARQAVPALRSQVDELVVVANGPGSVEGGTPAERLDRAFRKILTVPKDAILKIEHRERAEREKRREAKKKPH